jgi:hypothetical protein
MALIVTSRVVRTSTFEKIRPLVVHLRRSTRSYAGDTIHYTHLRFEEARKPVTPNLAPLSALASGSGNLVFRLPLGAAHFSGALGCITY